MFPRSVPVFALVIVILVLAAGCAPLPATGVSPATDAPGGPVSPVETAALAPTRAGVASTAMATETAVTAESSAAVTAEVTAEATATSTAAPSATSTAGAADAPPSGIERYRGPSAYGPAPLFEVEYDSAAWEYVEDDGSGRPSQLKHRSLAGCILWLRAGPVDASPVASVFRADREWKIAQVDSNIILYVAPEDRFAWIFGLILPEPYTGMANSACQDAAEQVIDTFEVVPESLGSS